MGVSLQELVSDIDELVSLPGVCLRINQMVDNPKSTASDIGMAISQDPGLTARLLRIANSPLYGMSTRIDTIARAVAVIGTKRIRDLVLAASTINAFEGIPNELVTMENFWRHSIYCGLAARVLGERHRKEMAEVLFVGGLLHDIGQLVIFRKIPQQAKEALLLSLEGPDELAMHLAEQQVIGFDHAQVGAELLRHWHFPENLLECVAYHHAPGEAKKFPLEAAITNIANSIATLAEVDSLEPEDAVRVDPVAWQISGLTPEIIGPTVRATQAQFADVKAMLS